MAVGVSCRVRLTLSMVFMTVAASPSLNPKAIFLFPSSSMSRNIFCNSGDLELREARYCHSWRIVSVASVCYSYPRMKKIIWIDEPGVTAVEIGSQAGAISDGSETENCAVP